MEKFWTDFMEKVRNYKTNKFGWLGKFFLKIGINAGIMTSLSLIFGLIAVYFLFDQYWLFILFGAMHYLADGLDGVIARISGPTIWGKYYDYFVDRIIELLLLVKIWLFLGDYFVMIVIALFLIAQTIHVISKFRYPALFTRSFLLLFAALSPLNFLIMLTLGYLITGVTSVYTLALQLKMYLQEN